MTLHIITPEYPPKTGGVATYSRQLARGLRDAGVDVHVWCPDGDDEAGCTVHQVMGAFSRADLAAARRRLDACPAPRRLLVQWVPHGYGYRSMNLGFCRWIAERARLGDRVELVVHEPFLSWTEGTARQAVAAAVHRLMTVSLLQAASHVWMSTPSWEAMWRPYALGRDIPFTWLPVPSPLPRPAMREVEALRAQRRDGGPIIGHLGTYGPHAAALLTQVLDRLHDTQFCGRVLLIGAGSRQFRAAYAASRGSSAVFRIEATGELDPDALATHVSVCDLLVQPYPDGISFRRTTAMAGLSLGVPIVSTRGYVTEPLWLDTSAVRIVPVERAGAIADHAAELLGDRDARERLARAGQELYERMFDLRFALAALNSGVKGQAA